MRTTTKQQAFGSGWLYAENFLAGGKFNEVTVTISDFHPAGTLTAADGRVIDKPALSFEGKDKRLALCKTNVAVITFVTGEQPGDKWIKKTITLGVRVIEAFGEELLAIRVMPPVGTVLRKGLIKHMGKPAPFRNGQEQKGM